MTEAHVTLNDLIGDTSHITCETSSFVLHNLTIQCWIYYNPKVVQKTPIIVIHGGPAFTHNYLLPLKLLADFGYPVVFYDQAGCGASTFVADPIKDAPWLLKVDYYVEELCALIHNFNLYEYYIYGSSWGTIVAQEFAVYCEGSSDAMLRGLVGMVLDGALCDGQLYIRTQWRDRISKLPSFTQNLLHKLTNEKAYDSPFYKEIDRVLSTHFTIRCVPTPDCFNNSLKGMNPVIYREMQGPSEFTFTGVLENWSITDRLWVVKVPTLVLRGEFDTMTEECSQEVVNHISTSWPLVCIPRAGHCKAIDEPHECVKEVTRFLNTLEGVMNRYKSSDALFVVRKARAPSAGNEESMLSPAKIFKRILPPPPEEKQAAPDTVVFLAQSVLPPVVIVGGQEDGMGMDVEISSSAVELEESKS